MTAITIEQLEKIKTKFRQESFRQGEDSLDYMLFSPSVKEGETCPLVLCLQGMDGQDKSPAAVPAELAGYAFALEEWQAKHPCHVLAVRVHEEMLRADHGFMMLLVSALMQFSMHGKLAVDPNRIYITGNGTGSIAVWKLISDFATVFAAAMPVCGAAEPFAMHKAFNVPVWAFHAENDPVIPAHAYLAGDLASLAGTGLLASALRCAGNPDVHYTEYPAGFMDAKGLHPHDAWIPAYEDDRAKEWLFAQNKSQRYEIRQIVPGFYWIEDHNWDSIYLIEGQDKALVVDTGLADNDFAGMIRSLTRLPFEIAITHNHGDHMLHINKFDRYYMNEKDKCLFETSGIRGMLGDRDYSKCELMPIADGD